MKSVTFYTPSSGKIIGVSVNSEDLVLSHMPAGAEWVLGIHNNQTHFIIDGNVTERPTTGLPAEKTIKTNTDWIIADVPAGTEVEIDKEVVAVTDDTELTLTFNASGIWPVTLRPPFPWVEASCEVTVT